MDSEKMQHNLKTGEEFNNLISAYPISGESLLRMCKVLCEFVATTQVTDIEKYFFVDVDKGVPRLPYMLDFEDQCHITANKIISSLKSEMYVDEQGNDVLTVGTNEYEQKWEYEIGVNHGLHKAIRIIKKYVQKL